MRKIRRTLPFLALIFTLLIINVFAEESENVYDIELNSSDESPGYLFEVSEETEYIEETESLYHLGGDIYYAETIEEIQEVCDTDPEYIEPDSTLTLFSEPNDTYYRVYQRSYMNLINAPDFWEYEITATGVVVAVIDTGLKTGHEDIDYSRVLTGYNYVRNTTDTSDTFGHGTYIAGIISATRNNSLGVAGLLNGVSILPLKVSDNGTSIYLSYVVNAIYDAVDKYGADVINLSMGDPGNYSSLESAVNYATEHNVIVVAAAGNNGTDVLQYPAAFPSVIGVGSVDKSGVVSLFSQRNSSVFVTAPGDGIYSTYTSTKYTYGDGTSFSAPFVTAMAAAAKSHWGDSLTTDQYKSILQSSVYDAGDPGYDYNYGYGVIDLKLFAEQIGYYDDVFATNWAYSYVTNATKMGLMDGTGTRTFEPEASMSRAMFVTMLGRYYESQFGVTISASTDSFNDTEDNVWYSNYVAWAAENEIIDGYDGNRFGPHDSVTREQAMTVLYRFTSKYSGASLSPNDSVLSGYTDQSSISAWAREAFAWAVESGIIDGVTGTTLVPYGITTRAQSSAIFIRYSETYYELVEPLVNDVA